MALREIDEPAGAPWERPLRGRLDRLVVESELLLGNPLGDPARRPLWVYRPPGATEPMPSIYVIQGYTGQADMWANRVWNEPTMLERVDALFADEGCPPALIVFIDAWTSYGGSQYLNSAATGPYQDYLCDEIVPFVDDRYPTLPGRDHRGIAGKSSGGYGAMVVPMMRPDVFGAFASHAGDALFEYGYVSMFAKVTRILRDHFESSYDVFFERFEGLDHMNLERFSGPLEVYGYAAAYSPDEERPGKALLPFDLRTGRIVDEVWARWLERDPVRMAASHADALRSMRRIYLDAGREDEYWLDLGAQAFAAELEKLGVDHTLELFEARHGGITYRYPGALRELALALAG
jgi:S-formylglutathione hydrolase FrmB